MSRTPTDLDVDDWSFLAERHLATLTTLRANGSPHVVAIAFTLDRSTGIATVISSDGSQKVVNAERGDTGAVCQVDGRRWLSLEGRTRVVRNAEAIAIAERRYTERYRAPRENPSRVVIEIAVERILGSA